MKIGQYEISKAFLGSLPLNSKNAYIGNYKMIDGDEPVEEWSGFKITSLQDANDVTINVAENTGTNSKIYALYTSLDEGQNWTTEFDTQQNKTITYTLNTGDTLCIKADANRWQYSSSNKGASIKATKNVNVSGNIMSLIYNDDFVDKTTFKNTADTYTFGYLLSAAKVVDAGGLILPVTTLTLYCYSRMFNGCTNLTTAPELPATTLANFCYLNMFYNCTSLTTAPELPATTLVTSCYSNMFYGCSGLTTTPELPATTLASSCYTSMFYGCKGLTSAPELPATTLVTSCYASMFNGCKGLTSAPELPATTLVNYCYLNMFYSCSGLTTAPELPATTLANGCYSSMFNGCTSLTQAPELPATTLANSCYISMFGGCTSLTQAPELPATTLVASCYSSMFNGCTSLTTAPELPATTLVTSCYASMFRDCTSLTTAPELPATTLAINCYLNMFLNCTSLTTAPELPATTLANYCYLNMFNSCTSLTQTPELPATTLVTSCYQLMFYNCSLINEVTIHISGSWNTSANNWLANVASSGTLYNLGGATNIPNNNSGCPTGWTIETTKPEPVEEWDGLTFTAEEANSTISLIQIDTPTLSYDFETSTDGEHWSTYTIGDVITLAKTGDKVCWRGNNTTMTERSGEIRKQFVMTGKIAASGNINSLLEKETYNNITSLPEHCYNFMFNECTSLTTAPKLPATTLADGCYRYMFGSCTSLTQAPELPATTLANGCYESMFGNCTSLTAAPVLPATTQANACYHYMFTGCWSLREVTVYASSWDTMNSWAWLSNGVPSTGTFYNLGGADIPTDDQSGCPTGWTIKTTKP